MKKVFQYQHDSMQCGIACLAMICRHYGKRYSIDFLSHICFASNEGISLLGISQAAEELGFKTISGRIVIKQLANSLLPCILHWNQNHFVILYKIKKGRKFYVADPGKGLLTYNLEEFNGIRDWVESMPKRKISMMILQNYTIVGL